MVNSAIYAHKKLRINATALKRKQSSTLIMPASCELRWCCSSQQSLGPIGGNVQSDIVFSRGRTHKAARRKKNNGQNSGDPEQRVSLHMSLVKHSNITIFCTTSSPSLPRKKPLLPSTTNYGNVQGHVKAHLGHLASVNNSRIFIQYNGLSGGDIARTRQDIS